MYFKNKETYNDVMNSGWTREVISSPKQFILSCLVKLVPATILKINLSVEFLKIIYILCAVFILLKANI